MRKNGDCVKMHDLLFGVFMIRSGVGIRLIKHSFN